jgi:hypothetical protein
MNVGLKVPFYFKSISAFLLTHSSYDILPVHHHPEVSSSKVFSINVKHCKTAVNKVKLTGKTGS